MASAEVTMIPQNYVELTDETAIKNLNRTLDLLDAEDDVQAVCHNWDEYFPEGAANEKTLYQRNNMYPVRLEAG